MSDPLSRTARRAALVSVTSNTILIVIKLVTAWASGSVSVLSEAVHSSMDLLASLIALVAVSVSRKPADRGHPWGHGKAENVSGVAEGLLIFVAAGLIVVEAVKKLLHPEPVTEPLLGVLVMGFSAAVNTGVALYLYRVAHRIGSLALEADALHLKTDVMTSAGVALGLGLMALTGWQILDPLVALAVAALIVQESWSLVRRSFGPLVDERLTEAEEAPIRQALDEVLGPGESYHDLKTRRAGFRVYLELHLVMPGTLSLDDAHRRAHEVEAGLVARHPEVEPVIHMEPPETPATRG